ncbi:hypothetical protein CGMCC3_g9767 [Colletotrichum fructicola]|uniref:Uncharacterized protein n=2 Tax=Colletotrichum gloeosporioides species complex TaxID=2707338 RepID=A0A7J6J289_COLFN|nr:uncharacterized protein CGMCC3_g9767 [Colletotrichum fructicola]KAF4483129.1 hypothetical protein CGGC5_v009149 [Colletotrichum fructicola Nara gc5]KAK1856072.1 hypothetical protein CCHR01_01286 [Colletotrichum chrysophilum]KAE9574137.1 hypothetical protein CGMCC3_g9767 [Colletotrichum fructicola]KAF4420655.1 hypothetical protein CFRS1_v004956 [Colletotrichum fructicola]KAF5509327.1 hypothetical protein CGCF413_v003719 [Colletotrichum fructicola]
MSDRSQKSNYSGDAPEKPSHKYFSADSATTQTKRRQAKFESAPDGSVHHVSDPSYSAQSSKSKHKTAAKNKINDFERQFNSHS